MMRHNWKSTLLFKNEVDLIGWAFMLFFPGFLGSLILAFFSFIVIGMPAQAIFSEMNVSVPTVALWSALILPVAYWIHQGILPFYHVDHGLDGIQQRVYRKYRSLSDRAKEGLPKDSKVRALILEADNMQLKELQDTFVRLYNADEAVRAQEKVSTPAVQSEAVNRLIASGQDKTEFLTLLQKEYKKANKELEHLR